MSHILTLDLVAACHCCCLYGRERLPARDYMCWTPCDSRGPLLIVCVSKWPLMAFHSSQAVNVAC